MLVHVSDILVYNPTTSNKLPNKNKHKNAKKLCFKTL